MHCLSIQLACMQLSISTLESITFQNNGHFNGFWSENPRNSGHSNVSNAARTHTFKACKMLQMGRDIMAIHTRVRRQRKMELFELVAKKDLTLQLLGV